MIRLKKALKPLGDKSISIYNDLRSLYDSLREQRHNGIKKISQLDDFLTFNEQKELATYLKWFALCLTPGYARSIHEFDLNLVNPLKNVIYGVIIQGTVKKLTVVSVLF